MKAPANKPLSLVILVAFLFVSTPALRVFASDAPPTGSAETTPTTEQHAEPPTITEGKNGSGEAPVGTGGETLPGETGGEQTSDSHSNVAGKSDDTPEVVAGGNTHTEASVDIKNENVAEVTNDVMSASNTGDNVVASEGEENAGGDATIVTGDSLAAVTVVNALNLNVIESQGFILFLQNILGSHNLNLDLREHGFLFGGNSAPPCDSLVCGDGTELRIANSNDLHIINTVEVGANTGGNTASGDNAEIRTGNAYASANILNLANTNIIDSRYLFLFFDSFGNYTGDIVLPSWTALERFFSSGSGISQNSVSVTNNNIATVVNNVTTSSDTGNNVAEGTGATVLTGNASSLTSVFNKLNTNIFDSGNFSVIFRVHGNWSGGVFSVPDGIVHTQGGPGFFSFTGSGRSGGAHSLASDRVTIQNSNNARIENNVVVTSTTGGNTAIGEDGDLISTGDAYASASVTNVANLNIIGRNWLFALINILGDFTGNISFGRPDLWVGGRVSTPGNPTNGSVVEYTYTITNKGDTAATSVSLRDLFASNFIEFVDSPNGARLEGDSIVWNIGSLAPGATIEVGYRGRVKNAPHGETSITNSVIVSAHEPDENASDNRETTSLIVRVSPPPSPSGQFLNARTSAVLSQVAKPMLLLERSNRTGGTVRVGDEVTYTLVVTNAGEESLYDVVLTDDLRGPSGEIIHTEKYPLGEVLPNEEITIEYTVLFDESFPYGIYWSSATVTAVDRLGMNVTTNPAIDVVNLIERVLTPNTPTITTNAGEPAEPNMPLIDLSQLAPIAHAAPPVNEDTLSNQAASVGLLGLDLYHYALIILLLLLAYEAARRHRESLYTINKHNK
jgi:uncharacterized repeat protein (TIGR01451 family)